MASLRRAPLDSLAPFATSDVLTVGATIAWYPVKGEWLERNGNTITAIVLVTIGAAAYAVFSASPGTTFHSAGR